MEGEASVKGAAPRQVAQRGRRGGGSKSRDLRRNSRMGFSGVLAEGPTGAKGNGPKGDRTARRGRSVERDDRNSYTEWGQEQQLQERMRCWFEPWRSDQ